MNITFDDSLPAFLQVLNRAGIDVAPKAGVFIRDLRGRLSFLAAGKLAPEIAQTINATVSDELKHYISPLGAIADRDAPGARRVLEDQEALLISIKPAQAHSAHEIKLLDRRAVGADWLHPPLEMVAAPPRLVFASLKGGVGRSTALSVLGAELAERGRAILVVDLDMEAPGIGSMLIAPDATPPFGSIDFFVEGGLRQLNDTFMLDCVGASWVSGGRGRIDASCRLWDQNLSTIQEVCLASLPVPILIFSVRMSVKRLFLHMSRTSLLG